jgi:hypothetical protein
MKGIITLCGSTKFKPLFEEINRRLTWSDWIVLSVGSFQHSEKDHDIAGQIIQRKIKLDKLHKEKIALSWAIVVLNQDGYVGDSTKSEIGSAQDLGKKIYWWDWTKALWQCTEEDSWQELLDESPDDLIPLKVSGEEK